MTPLTGYGYRILDSGILEMPDSGIHNPWSLPFSLFNHTLAGCYFIYTHNFVSIGLRVWEIPVAWLNDSA